MAFGFGIAAEQPEEVRAERAARRPRLLAGEAPTAAGFVAHRAALDPGEVAARVRFRPALAPGVLAGRHLGQHVVLLLLRTELEDGGREQEDPVLGDALRRAGGVVLLLEDQPLPQAGLAPAVLARPRHHRVAGVEEGPLPLEMGGEPLAGVARGAKAGRGTLASSHERHSARNCSSAGLKERSMGAGIVASVVCRAGSRPGELRGRNRPDLVIAATAARPHNGRMSRRIVFVTYPGITALDLVGPHEVFTAAAEVARRTGGEPDAYRVEVASMSRARSRRPAASWWSPIARSPPFADRSTRWSWSAAKARTPRRTIASSSRGSGARLVAAAGWRRCAPAHSCSRPRACSTAAAPPRIGERATTSRASIPT